MGCWFRSWSQASLGDHCLVRGRGGPVGGGHVLPEELGGGEGHVGGEAAELVIRGRGLGPGRGGHCAGGRGEGGLSLRGVVGGQAGQLGQVVVGIMEIVPGLQNLPVAPVLLHTLNIDTRVITICDY